MRVAIGVGVMAALCVVTLARGDTPRGAAIGAATIAVALLAARDTFAPLAVGALRDA